MTGNAADGSAPEERPQENEPGADPPDEDPGYLTRTGEAVGDDGSVVPVIGGLPAAEGSAWDIGAAADDRGAELADEQRRNQAGDED